MESLKNHLSKKYTSSLTFYNDEELINLNNKLSTKSYKSFHDIVIDITDCDNIIEIKTKKLNDKISDLKKNFEEKENELQNELNNFKFKQKEEINERIENMVSIRKENIELKIENKYNGEISSLTNQVRNDNIQIKDLNNTIDYLKSEVNEFKNENNELKNPTLKSNKELGDSFEDRVKVCLNKTHKYNSLVVQDSSDIQKHGDLVVLIPELNNMNILIECKNKKEIKTESDIKQFNEHKKDFFNKLPNSHALFLSSNCDKIPNIGSYHFTWEDEHLVLFYSSKNMTDDQIICHFLDFVQKIIESSNENNNYNQTNNLCVALSNNNKLIIEEIGVFEKNKQISEKQIDQYNEKIKKLNKRLQENVNILTESDYVEIINQNIEKIPNHVKYENIITFLKEKGLSLDNNTTKNEIIKFVKKINITKKDILKEFNLSDKISWDDILNSYIIDNKKIINLNNTSNI